MCLFALIIEMRLFMDVYSIMLNPIEKFRVAILHLNRDWNH